MKEQIYAIYRGDKFVDVGTLEELHERTGISIDNLRWYSYPTYHKRNKGNALLVYKIDMEDEENERTTTILKTKC